MTELLLIALVWHFMGIGWVVGLFFLYLVFSFFSGIVAFFLDSKK